MPLSFKKDRLSYQKYLTEVSKLSETNQARVYMGLILTILTVIFFMVFALRPTFLTIAGLISEIETKKEINAKLGIKVQQLSQAQALYSQIVPQLYLVDEALPVENELSSLLNNLELAAVQTNTSFSGLSFEEIDLVNEKNEEGRQEIKFQGALAGKFEDLDGFLKQIFSLRRIVRSNQLNFTKKDDFLILSTQLISFFQIK